METKATDNSGALKTVPHAYPSLPNPSGRSAALPRSAPCCLIDKPQ